MFLYYSMSFWKLGIDLLDILLWPDHFSRTGGDIRQYRIQDRNIPTKEWSDIYLEDKIGKSKGLNLNGPATEPCVPSPLLSCFAPSEVTR